VGSENETEQYAFHNFDSAASPASCRLCAMNRALTKALWIGTIRIWEELWNTLTHQRAR
jgi:hypothetical protein